MAWTYTEYDGLRIPELSRVLYEFAIAVNERELLLGRGDCSDPESVWAEALETADEMGWTDDFGNAQEPLTRWLCHDGTERVLPTWEQWSAPYQGQSLADDHEAWFAEKWGLRPDYPTLRAFMSLLRFPGDPSTGLYCAETGAQWCGHWAAFFAVNITRLYFALYNMKTNGHEWSMPRHYAAYPISNPEAGVISRWFVADTQFASWFVDTGTWPPEKLRVYMGRTPQSVHITAPIMTMGDVAADARWGAARCLEWVRDTLDAMKQCLYVFGAYRPCVLVYEYYQQQPWDYRYRTLAPARRVQEYPISTTVGNSNARLDPLTTYDPAIVWAEMMGATLETHAVKTQPISRVYWQKTNSIKTSVTPSNPYVVTQSASAVEYDLSAYWPESRVRGVITSIGIPATAQSRLCRGADYVLPDGTEGVTPDGPAVPYVRGGTLTTDSFPVSLSSFFSSIAEPSLDESYTFRAKEQIDGFFANPNPRYAREVFSCTASVSYGNSAGYANLYTPPSGYGILPQWRIRCAATPANYTAYNHAITDITGDLTYG